MKLMFNLLMTRSEIAKREAHLSDTERQRLLNADQLLLKQASQLYQSIRDVADLASWRHDETVPATHWRWYLDVITQMQQQTQPRDVHLAYAGA